MPNEEWGTKRICPTTGKRFYDLNKDPIVSPYTGETVILDTARAGRMMVADKADRDAKQDIVDDDEVVLEDDEVELDDDDDDDVLADEPDDDDVSLDDIADVADDGDDD